MGQDTKAVTDYDPMIAKVIVTAEDFPSALEKVRRHAKTTSHALATTGNKRLEALKPPRGRRESSALVL